ncbi:MAG: hypothetical protein ACI8S6_000172 [Myxococcota bacterium]|jgi:hypothetical protein
MVPFLLLLLACRDPKTDTASHTDTAAATDSGLDADSSVVLRFVFPEDLSGAALSLIQHDPVTGALLGTLTSTAITGAEAELVVAAPELSSMYWLVEEGFPDTAVARFHPVVSDDPDGDGAHSDGEEVLAVGAHQPLYVVGSALPASWIALGIEPGWSVLRDKSLIIEPDLVDPANIPVELNLTPVPDLTLQGEGPTTPDARIAVALYQTLAGIEDLDSLDDQVWTGEPWSVHLTGPPPEEALYDWDSSGYRYAIAFPILYTDTDGSEGVSSGDEAISLGCLDGAAVGAIWLPRPTSIDIAVSLSAQGLSTGWSHVAFSDGGLSWLSPDKPQTITFDDSCSL